MLGDQDGQVVYDEDCGTACHHLHHHTFKHEGFAFLNYSGLPAHWGLDPTVLQIQIAIARRHEVVNARSAELEEAEKAEVARVDAEATEGL